MYGKKYAQDSVLLLFSGVDGERPICSYPLFCLRIGWQHDRVGFLGFYGLAIVYGSILSFPSMCLFWAVAAFVFSRPWRKKAQKLTLYGWASVLTILPFWLIFGKDDPKTHDDVVKMAICYLLTILIGIGRFRLPLKARSEIIID